MDSERLRDLLFRTTDLEAVSKILANAGQPALTTKDIVQRRYDVLAAVNELIHADRSVWLVGGRSRPDAELTVREAVPIEFQQTIFGQQPYQSEASSPTVGAALVRAISERTGMERFKTFECAELRSDPVWKEVLPFWESQGLQPGLWLVYRAYTDCFSIVGFQRKLHRPKFEDRDFALGYMVFRDIVSLHRSVFCRCEVLSNRLPARKREVLELLLAGDSIKAIAAKLNLSRYTIGDHVKEIYKHFEVESRSELLAKFIAN